MIANLQSPCIRNDIYLGEKHERKMDARDKDGGEEEEGEERKQYSWHVWPYFVLKAQSCRPVDGGRAVNSQMRIHRDDHQQMPMKEMYSHSICNQSDMGFGWREATGWLNEHWQSRLASPQSRFPLHLFFCLYKLKLTQNGEWSKYKCATVAVSSV